MERVSGTKMMIYGVAADNRFKCDNQAATIVAGRPIFAFN